MTHTIKVTNMKNLKEGDVVQLPKATLTRTDPLDGVLLEFKGGEAVWIHPDCVEGIEVTRELESKFNLTWPEALDAMFTGGPAKTQNKIMETVQATLTESCNRINAKAEQVLKANGFVPFEPREVVSPCGRYRLVEHVPCGMNTTVFDLYERDLSGANWMPNAHPAHTQAAMAFSGAKRRPVVRIGDEILVEKQP